MARFPFSGGEKEESRTYLESHVHPGDNVVVTNHFCGQDFLSCVADHALLIDKFRSRTDQGYTKLSAIRACLAKPLGLNDPEALIPLALEGPPGG